ncbi:MAG TPA: hypothetical protein PLN69_05210 [bacterium]|nr:hypothetical protein [bacterium]
MNNIIENEKKIITISDYARELDTLIDEENARLKRMMSIIRESKEAISKSSRIFNPRK